MDNLVQTFFNLFLDNTEDLILDKATLDLMKGAINEWLEKNQRINESIKEYFNSLSRYKKLLERKKKNNFSGKQLTELYENYTSQKNDMRLVNSIEELDNHLKTGYTIAFSKQNEAEIKLIENLSLDELSDAAQVSNLEIKNLKSQLDKGLLDSRKIFISGSRLSSILEEQTNNISAVLKTITKMQLWDSIISTQKEVYQQYNEENGKKLDINLGRVLEVYRILNNKGINYVGHLKGKQNTINLAKSLLRNSIGENIDFYKLGDVGLEQLKTAINGSTAGVATGKQINKYLIKLKNILNSTTKEKLKSKLIEFFTPKEKDVRTEIDKAVVEEAKKSIDKKVFTANLDIK